ncbi:MAG TPA: DUF998 domain-containing protein [Thermoanaerobaculia bacterium]
MPRSERVLSMALWAGVLVPFLYFGAQLVAARFYPGNSFVRQSASELGSDRSLRPAVLNTGAMATGVATMIAAFGITVALRRQNTPRVVAWLVGLAMLSMGAAAIWAGLFALPDPRHNPGAIGAGAFVLPALFALAAWKLREAQRLKIYLLANVLLFVLLIPVMSGVSGIPIDQQRGVMQRVAASVLYLPVGVVAGWLLRRARQSTIV